MFTGIIEDLALVRALDKKAQGATLEVESKKCSPDAKIGDSISVNGACLTITKIIGNQLFFDVSNETICRSSLKELKANDMVNLERALRADGRLGGHFVTGHIDTTAKISAKSKKGDFIEIRIEIPKPFVPFFIEKGSVAVDGISLTVNSVDENFFNVAIIPQTISHTTLKVKQEGDSVNIETDIFAKYIHKYINGTKDSKTSPPSISSNFLKEHGFF